MVDSDNSLNPEKTQQRASQTLRQASSQTKDKVDQAKNKFDTIREKAQDLASEAGTKLRDITGQSPEKAKELWSQAGSWVNENRGIGVIGLVVAVGVAGFLIGRASSSSESMGSSESFGE